MPNTNRITLSALGRHYGATFDPETATATRAIELGRLVSPEPDELHGQYATIEVQLRWVATHSAKNKPERLYYGKPQLSIAGAISPEQDPEQPRLLIWDQNRELLLDRVQDDRWPMIERLWRLYHLNAAHEECSHMRELDWWPADHRSFPAVKFQGTSRGIHQLTKTQHPKGLLGRACKICGHRYGSDRLYEMIPSDDLRLIDHLIVSPELSLFQTTSSAA